MKQLENLNEKDLVFYDIETARAVEVLEEGTPIYDAWAYKARYQNELNRKTGEQFTMEEYFTEKAALYATFGRVVSIVVGRIKGNKLSLKAYSSYDEKELLEDFNKDLELVYKANPKVRFVSFNGVGFDTPYLEKRSIVNGVKPANLLQESHLEPWKVTQLDLSKIWKGNAFYPDSLVAVATALGLPSPKDALDGSQVSGAFYEKRLPEITAYCLKDVETTARIYRKLAFGEDLDEDVIVLNSIEKEAPAPFLQRVYMEKSFDKATKAEIEAITKGNLEDIDRAHLVDILLSVLTAKGDKVGDKKARKLEVEEFVKSL